MRLESHGKHKFLFNVKCYFHSFNSLCGSIRRHLNSFLTYSNSLDPNQDRQKFIPGLRFGSKPFDTLIEFVKEIFEKG